MKEIVKRRMSMAKRIISKKVMPSKRYSMPIINEETIAGILRHPKFFRGHVRTAAGKIYKTGEFEKRSDRVLGMRLP